MKTCSNVTKVKIICEEGEEESLLLLLFLEMNKIQQ